jgi:hypothetical protein
MQFSYKNGQEVSVFCFFFISVTFRPLHVHFSDFTATYGNEFSTAISLFKVAHLRKVAVTAATWQPCWESVFFLPYRQTAHPSFSMHAQSMLRIFCENPACCGGGDFPESNNEVFTSLDSPHTEISLGREAGANVSTELVLSRNTK